MLFQLGDHLALRKEYPRGQDIKAPVGSLEAQVGDVKMAPLGPELSLKVAQLFGLSSLSGLAREKGLELAEPLRWSEVLGLDFSESVKSEVLAVHFELMIIIASVCYRLNSSQ